MDIIEQALNPGTRMPLLIQSREPGLPAADYAAARREHLLSRVEACGAVVLRGFAVPDAAAFGAFVEALRLAPMPYLYRSTPRTSVAGGLYTATEYPADREIPLHNENAYQRSWPHKIAFCCLQPAAGGGATPLADMLEVQRRLDPALLARFGRLGVRYDRVYHEGFDLPWTVVFQTSERAELQRFCQANQIEHEWLEDGSLRTRQVSQGTVIHPASGREYFFNQAHLFHPPASARKPAPTWWTPSARTACRATPASATASRSTTPAWPPCAPPSTQPRSTSPGSAATSCWPTTSRSRTAGAATPASAAC